MPFSKTTCLRACEEHRKATRLPVIVPVVLAHDKTLWRIRPRFGSLLFHLPDSDRANAATRAAAVADADDEITAAFV